MDLIKFSDFLRYARFFYKSVGLRPYDEPWHNNSKHTFIDDIIFYVNIINLNINTLSEALLVLVAFINGNNFVEATVSLSYVCFDIVCSTKMFFVWLKKRQLNQLITELYEIFPKNFAEQQELQTSKHLRQCTNVTFAFSLLYMVLIWTYNLFMIAEWFIFDVLLQWYTVEKALPYTMYIPWDYHDNWSYYLLYALQSLAGYTSAAGQIFSDLMLCALATQLIMHYEYIGHTLDIYNSLFDLKRKFNKTGEDEQDLKFIRNVITYHEKILSVSILVNDVFGIPLLINFMTSSFVICFVGFQLTLGETGWAEKFQLLLFLLSSMAQLYLICHYGQLLSDASTNIAGAVYSHNWLDAGLHYKRKVLLILMRSQKPSQLRATSVVRVARDTMTDTMHMSYSFFALLCTMYAK